MNVLPISVLIPTMNRPETLKRTLDTYTQADRVPSQIVVVDQSQDTETAKEIEKIVKSFEGIETVYVYQETPSLTAARNNALKYAKEEIIVCSDDDVDVYKDTLYNVYRVMSDESVSMIAGLDDKSGGKNGSIGYLLGTRSFKKRRIGHVTLSMLGRFPDEVKGQVDTEWAMGFFFSVKKSLIMKWNLRWDENLTSYAFSEDLDFSYAYFKNSRKENLRCVFDETVHVKHMVSREYRVPSKKSTFMYVINRYYLSYKHNMGFRSRLAMKWCNFWRLIEKILRKEKPGDFINAQRCLRKNIKKVKSGEIKDLC